MTLKSTPARYGAVTQTIHWLTAFLVLAAYLLGEGGPERILYSAERATQLNAHETLGVAVLALLVLRIVWRIFDPTPKEAPSPGWIRITSRIVQGLLYLLLIAIPVTAILGAWFTGHPIFVAGSEVGPFTGLSHDLGEGFFEVHETLANLILIVAGVHAVAALFHHFVLRDGVLLTMLPFGRARG